MTYFLVLGDLWRLYREPEQAGSVTAWDLFFMVLFAPILIPGYAIADFVDAVRGRREL